MTDAAGRGSLLDHAALRRGPHRRRPRDRRELQLLRGRHPGDGRPAPSRSADIDASVPSIGLYGSLAPHYEGTITGTTEGSAFVALRGRLRRRRERGSVGLARRSTSSSLRRRPGRSRPPSRRRATTSTSRTSRSTSSTASWPARSTTTTRAPDRGRRGQGLRRRAPTRRGATPVFQRRQRGPSAPTRSRATWRSATTTSTSRSSGT